MSRGGFNNRRRRRRSDHVAHDASDERWLLTYADMITLLMALFIVMWAISTVNEAKFEDLKRSLKGAFSGDVAPGGAPHKAAKRAQPSVPQQRRDVRAAAHELEDLQRIKAAVDDYARDHAMADRLRTSIDERGLVIRMLTDDVLFAPGEAVLKTRSLPALGKISSLLSAIDNPVRVEGNTDNVPIATARFRSNWELSTTRATVVLQYLLAHGVGAKRLSAAGYADQHPLTRNSSARGRALNRRVELVVLRRYAWAVEALPR